MGVWRIVGRGVLAELWRNLFGALTSSFQRSVTDDLYLLLGNC